MEFHWLVAAILRLVINFMDWISEVIFKFIWDGYNQRLPPVDNSILLKPATTLASEIRSGELKSELVVQAFINRIKEVNGILNCVVDTRFDAALEEAKAVDRTIANTENKSKLAAEQPFLGVPFTAKDCFAVKGFSWSVGLWKRRYLKADRDADSVKLMRQAGAIPIGVTNVSELCLWIESSNRVYGRTNNPYHPGRTVGGSSGGEACVIAAAASVFGISSDVGGSIRIPSFFCGTFGHKPSKGIVPNGGQRPKAEGSINTDMLVTGPQCRFACDLLPMYKVLAGPKSTTLLHLDSPVDITKLKVYYMEDDTGNPLTSRVQQELIDIMRSVVHTLELEFGIVAKKVELKDFYHTVDIWAHCLASEELNPTCAEEMTDREGSVSPIKEFLKWMCFQNSDHTLPTIMLSIIEMFIHNRHPDHSKYVAMREHLRSELEDLLGSDGILLYPSHPTIAPYHGQALCKPVNFAYTAVFNATGHPVTQVPLGVGTQGMPLGIQLVSGLNQDRNSLALALELEKLYKGWLPPFQITVPNKYYDDTETEEEDN